MAEDEEVVQVRVGIHYQAIVPEVINIIVFRKYDDMVFDRHLFLGCQVCLDEVHTSDARLRPCDLEPV